MQRTVRDGWCRPALPRRYRLIHTFRRVGRSCCAGTGTERGDGVVVRATSNTVDRVKEGATGRRRGGRWSVAGLQWSLVDIASGPVRESLLADDARDRLGIDHLQGCGGRVDRLDRVCLYVAFLKTAVISLVAVSLNSTTRTTEGVHSGLCGGFGSSSA